MRGHRGHPRDRGGHRGDARAGGGDRAGRARSGSDLDLDVTAPDAGERLLAACERRAPWALVNNAGTSSVRPLDELTDEEWQEQWELHVMGPMRLMRALAPVMAEAGGGRIVNVSSSSGKRPVEHERGLLGTKAARALAEPGVRGRLGGPRRAGERRGARARWRAGCGRRRAAWPTRSPSAPAPPARRCSGRDARQAPARAHGRARRRSPPRSSSSAPSARRTWPAPRGRWTAAASRRSSDSRDTVEHRAARADGPDVLPSRRLEPGGALPGSLAAGARVGTARWRAGRLAPRARRRTRPPSSPGSTCARWTSAKAARGARSDGRRAAVPPLVRGPSGRPRPGVRAAR